MTLNVVIFRWYKLKNHKNNNVEASGDFSYDICMHELIYLSNLV